MHSFIIFNDEESKNNLEIQQNLHQNLIKNDKIIKQDNSHKNLSTSNFQQNNAYRFSKIYMKSQINSKDFELNRVKIISHQLFKMGFNKVLIDKQMREIEKTENYSNQQLINIVANKLAEKFQGIQQEGNSRRLETQGENKKIEKMRSFVMSIRQKFHSKKPKIDKNREKLRQSLYPRISYTQSKLYLTHSQMNIQFKEEYDDENQIYQFDDKLQNSIDQVSQIYKFEHEEESSNDNKININLNSQINKNNKYPNQINDNHQECTICLEYKNKSDIMKICNHHEFCFDCISEYFSYKIENGDVSNIKCIKEGCPLESKQEDIELFISPKLFQRYMKLKVKNQNEQDKNLYQCPKVDCDGFCGIIDGLCMECFQYSCAICHQNLHPGINCEQVPDQEMQKAIIDYKIAPCPSCKSLIQKNNGCNHITCTNCQYQFCWLCGKQYNQGHFSNGFRQCQQFKNGIPYNQNQGNNDDDIQQLYNGRQIRRSCMSQFCRKIENDFPVIAAIMAIFLFPITLCIAWMGVMYTILKPNNLDDQPRCIKNFVTISIIILGFISFPIVWLGSAALVGIVISIILIAEIDASFEVCFYASCVLIPIILVVFSIKYSIQAVYNYDDFVERVVRVIQ